MHRRADEFAIDEDIRRIVQEHGRVSEDVSALARDADLYDAGMSSHASVSVMLALEDRFDVEFPEHMLVPGVFQSISAISAALNELRQPARTS
jgi:acyl carrier protein